MSDIGSVVGGVFGLGLAIGVTAAGVAWPRSSRLRVCRLIVSHDWAAVVGV